MPSPSELSAAKEMLELFRGDRVLAVTISYDDWRRETNAGLLKTRSSEFEAIDAALKDYHTQGKTEAAGVKLRQAFDNWIRAQQRAGKTWTSSDRNKSGMVSKLHEQLLLVEAGRSIKQMGNTKDWEGRLAILGAEREALETLFRGRKLVFKTSVKTGLQHVVQQYATGVKGYRAVSNLTKGASGAVTSESVANAFTKVGGDIPEHIATAFGVSADALCSACANVLNYGTAPVKLLSDVVNLGMGVKARVTASRSRLAFAPGNADAALDAVIRLLDQELMLIGKDMAQHAAHVVGAAFAAGPIVGAANAVVDLIVNNALYAQQIKQMRAGNEKLAMGRLSLDLFSASPVLGCYFLLMADTSMWVNFSVHDMGTDGWTRQIETLIRRAEPVRDKAREYVRVTKYALSGSEGFNGVEWEPSWRNNKIAYLKAKMSGNVGSAVLQSVRAFG